MKPDRDAPIGVFDSGVGGLTAVSYTHLDVYKRQELQFMW